MDGIALASVISSATLGALGVGSAIWSTHVTQGLVREGRFAERQIDAYLEILRLIEHKTLWWQRRALRLEASDDYAYKYGHLSLPELPRAPEVGELATIDALLAAFGSRALVESCAGWVASSDRLDELFEIAAWNFNENYHGEDTETDPEDLASIRQEIWKLRAERAKVGAAIRREIEVARKRD